MQGSSVGHLLLWTALIAPALMLVLLTLGAICGRMPSEGHIRRVFSILTAMVIVAAGAVAALVHSGGDSIILSLGSSPLYMIDGPGSLLLFAGALIIGIAGNFSLTYLHRDTGFHRYFFAYVLFFVGICQVFAAANAGLFVAGWELIGMSSAMLIAYFQERREPITNSRLAFGFFRIGDVGLLSGVAVFCHLSGTNTVPWVTPNLPVASVPLTVALIAIAFGAAVKMSLLPFVSWLPRAMEGPTPSSAIYYGALSVHAGAFLLWRISPQLLLVPYLGVVLFCLGISTSLFAIWCGRIRPDVKTQLAYASMGQLGLICAEIAVGWHNLAFWHILGHMGLRTLQFLTSPSALHTFRSYNIERPSALDGFHLAKLLPMTLQRHFYRLGLAELHILDTMTSLVVQPFSRLSEALLQLDRRVLAHLRFLLEREPRKTRDTTSSVSTPDSKVRDNLRMEFP